MKTKKENSFLHKICVIENNNRNKGYLFVQKHKQGDRTQVITTLWRSSPIQTMITKKCIMTVIQ